MSIFIKNPEVERKARELAKLKGQSMTQVIGEALERPLAEARILRPKRRPTLEEITAATDKFRRAGARSAKARASSRSRNGTHYGRTGVAEIDKAILAVDASAIVALALEEPEQAAVKDHLRRAEAAYISPTKSGPRPACARPPREGRFTLGQYVSRLAEIGIQEVTVDGSGRR